jgi:hypothetical protein
VRGERSELDERLEGALATLDAVGIWELEAVAAALEKRDDGLRAFAGVFREVADARACGYESGGARWTLKAALRGLDNDSAARLEGASSPFWTLVLDARPEVDGDGW